MAYTGRKQQGSGRFIASRSDWPTRAEHGKNRVPEIFWQIGAVTLALDV